MAVVTYIEAVLLVASVIGTTFSLLRLKRLRAEKAARVPA
jgi:hypothetical protein